MSDLTMFLLARIAEDEAVARAWAGAYNNPGSHPDYHYATMRRHRREWPVLWRSLDAYPPARVLAECKAKRRIVEAFADAERAVATYDHNNPIPAYWQEWGNRHALASVLEYLALPYADHTSYNEAWRP